MIHRAVFWVGGSIYAIVESLDARVFAKSVRNQIIECELLKDNTYTIEISHAHSDKLR